MPNTLVYQIELRLGGDYSKKQITVSLYNGETLAGECQSHTGGWASNRTLSCDRVVADRVRLTMTSTSWTTLYVEEIRVTGASTNTIGM